MLCGGEAWCCVGVRRGAVWGWVVLCVGWGGTVWGGALCCMGVGVVLSEGWHGAVWGWDVSYAGDGEIHGGSGVWIAAGRQEGSMDLMFTLGLKEAADWLAVAGGVHWCGHVLGKGVVTS